MVLSLAHSSCEFVSGFEFRISDFGSPARSSIRLYTISTLARPSLALALAFAGTSLFAAEPDAPAHLATTNRYQFRQDHDPNGIGKFYLGREIAHVMGHEAAEWLERDERNQEEDTQRLVQELPIKPGDVVADIGAGTGYLSRRLATKVGPQGKVLSEDIQPEMLDLLRTNLAKFGLTNVSTVLGTTTDPKLPPQSVNVAVMMDVYHEFDFPFEMVEAICRDLKPGGRLVLVEFRAEDPKVPIKLVHKMTEAQVKKEMAGHPLEWLQTKEVLPWQHIFIFQKTSLPQ
jgi:ubiquinone/menaquinone biosynthesis C-methylase UbiE